MIIKYLNINELNTYEICLKVSPERIKRSEKYKHEEDRKRSIAVEYLLNQMINEEYPEIETPVTLHYDSKGKPHIYGPTDKKCEANENGSQKTDLVHFSLSHSGDYVACMVSDVECGVDIERHSEKRDYEKVAKRICTEKEQERITDIKSFYDIWTLKESVLKAVGAGLSLDMKKVELEITGQGDDESIKTTVDGKTYRGKLLSAPLGYSLSYVELN